MSILIPIRRVLGVALFIAKPISREWSSHLLMLISSLWIVIPFYAFGGKALAAHALVGALMNMVFSVCIYSAYEEALYALQGIRDLFLASPLRGFELRAGIALGVFLTTTPSVVVCLIPLLAVTRCSFLQFVLVVAIIIVLWIVSTLIGYLIPVRRNILATGNIIRILSLALIALPPVYYPLSVWPEPLRPIAYAVPTFNIAQLMKIALGIEPYTLQQVAIIVLALAIEIAIIAFMACRLTRSA